MFDNSCRIPDSHCIWGYVLNYNGARTDTNIIANLNSPDNNCICPYINVITNDRGIIVIVSAGILFYPYSSRLPQRAVFPNPGTGMHY